MRRAKCAASTVLNESYVLRRFIAWLGRDIQIQHLHAEKVEEWFYGPTGIVFEHTTRDRRTRPGVQTSSHNYYRHRLASFFRYATARGLIREDLLVHVQPMKIERKQRQQPRPAVLLRMLDLTDCPRDRTFLATAMNTGLRASEITSIRVGNVDLDAGWILVNITKTSEQDNQPISLDLDTELRRWLTAYATKIGRSLRPDDHLFPGQKNSVYVWHTAEDGSKVRDRTPGTWNPQKPMTHPERVVQGALRLVGLPTRYEGVHTLRRAIARNFFDSLVSDPSLGYDGALRTVSALLHHKNAATTEHYLGLTSERERRDKALRGKPFLTAMVDTSNVITLRSQADGG